MAQANLSHPVCRGRGRIVEKLLNTLYVTNEGAALRKEGENIVVSLDGEERLGVPFHMLAAIVAFGPIALTQALIGAAAAAGITITLLERSGRFLARVEGPVAGNVLLRRAQYRASDSPTKIVRSLVLGKIANQRAVLMQALRDYGTPREGQMSEVEKVAQRLAMILRRVEKASDTIDLLRGAEGEGAGLYFGVFGHLMRTDATEFRWKARSRRPPLDPPNALLSFLYTLLVHDCRAACESVGLDPAVGFLHRDRPGRPSLALDLMEELRPPLADRLVLSLINRRQVAPRDFVAAETGAITLTDDARRTVIAAWQERKKEERVHPFLEEVVPFGLVPYIQAQMLARTLRGDLSTYPPWFWT